jgi:lysophospholipase L1-like esterase
MRRFHFVLAVLPLLLGNAAPAPAADPEPLAGVRRVIFLGDSITYSGQYIEFIEAYLRIHSPALPCELLDLGLPSETVSGLSEPGHAGGKFPRPDLHERLDRVLNQARPDLIVACYGMNDGIYYPLDAERFARFKDGMHALRKRAEGVGAKVLHVTPPVFDPVPIKARTLPAGLAEYPQPFEGYDEVLAHYSHWLLAQRASGWDVVDVHGPMARFLAQERAVDPGFRLASDGVHINAAGHWLIAREVLLHWGLPAPGLAGTTSGEQVFAKLPHGPEVLKLVQQKQRLLKDAWLSATGHKRPGMKQGIALEQAELRAGELDAEIRKLNSTAPGRP